jgi:hypothetical protein
MTLVKDLNSTSGGQSQLFNSSHGGESTAYDSSYSSHLGAKILAEEFREFKKRNVNKEMDGEDKEELDDLQPEMDVEQLKEWGVGKNI